jgi:hypothetical protein
LDAGAFAAARGVDFGAAFFERIGVRVAMIVLLRMRGAVSSVAEGRISRVRGL